MQTKVTVVCIFVGILGIFSAAAGFAAEATRNKVSKVIIVGDTCVYPSSPARGLGLTAAAILLLAKVIINSGRCCTCCRKSNLNKSANSHRLQQGIFSSISWVTFVIAIYLLVRGALLNKQKSEVIVKDYGYYCGIVPSAVFVAGAALTLVSVFSGIIYIILASGNKNNFNQDLENQPPVANPVAQANNAHN